MKHTTSKRFWQCFDGLPAEIQALARRNYQLLTIDPGHPSLQFKQLGGGKLWSVRVGSYYRALGTSSKEGVHWFWLGTHGEYDKLVG